MNQQCFPKTVPKSASSWDYGTYHIYRHPRSLAIWAFAVRRSLEADEGPDKKSDIKPHWMAEHAYLKNEFAEDKKYHNLMKWLKYSSRKAPWHHDA